MRGPEKRIRAREKEKTSLKTAILTSAVQRLVQLVVEDVEQLLFIFRADAEERAGGDGRTGVVDGTADCLNAFVLMR